MSSGQRYYRPYISSDSESESESDCSTSSSSASSIDPDSVPNFRQFATNLQLVKTGGPSFSTMSDQLFYHQRTIHPNALYSDYSKAFDPIKVTFASKEGFTTIESFAAPLPPAPAQAVGTTAPAPKATDKVASIILLNSRDRDRKVYPQPTFVRLQLPRVYRNVVSFQVMQVSLLTSFYYFRPDKFNIDLTILEQGRTTTDQNGNVIPLKIYNKIRQGSYNINSLLTEITKWLNNVPLFADFVNGFSDFQSAFQSTGDFGVNFNEAGDFFYDNLQNDFVPNPTKDLIISRFWKNRYSSQSSYTIDQVRMAYYYPPLKEILLDDNYTGQVNLTAGIGIDPNVLTTTDVQNHIVYTFQGINDQITLAVINGNQTLLDTYRLSHTFRYTLVNKYALTVQGQGQQVIFTSASLNTSLLTLLNNKNTQFYNAQFSLNSITSNQFLTLSNANNNLLAVLQDMNAFQQKQFASYFAVPFNNYVPAYYGQLNWTIQTRNGIGAIGIPTGYTDSNYNPTTAKQISQNIIAPLSQEPPHYFTNMTGLPSTIDTFKIFGDFNYPYSINNCNINLNSNVISPSTNYLLPALKGNVVNAIIHISSSKYTVFEFASPVRQTLQIETLPRPTQYRVPAYNSINYNSTIQKFFDASYAFVTSPFKGKSPYTYALDNIPQSNIIDISGWSLSNARWGLNYDSSFSTIYNNLLTINVPNKSLYLSFTAPDSNNYSTSSTFRYQLNIDTLAYDLSGNLTMPRQPMRIFFYKDRGGFMADVSGNRQESPYNAIASTILSTTMCNVDFPLTVYPKQKMYMAIRPDENTFGSIALKVVPYFSTGYKIETLDTTLDGINPLIDNPYNPKTLSNYNYAQIYDSNFLSLPIISTLWPPDPTVDGNQNTLFSSNTPIGYDVNNVSDDYTDYMPFIVGRSTNFCPSNILVGIDPITQYQFESNSPYDIQAQSFLYPGSKNGILMPGLIDVYNISTVINRQDKIVHYYSLNYIISGWDVSYYAPYITSNIVQLPYSQYSTRGSTIRGYEYSLPISSNDSNKYLSLGVGPCGFSFTPSEGIWDMDRIVIRSAFTDSNNDPNRAIKYLAVYNMQDIINKQTPTISMRSSIVVLSNTARVTYNPNDPGSLSGGFDVTGGTYYQFQKIQMALSNPNSTIVGFSESQGTITNDPSNLYSILAFDSNEIPTTIRAMSGSLVPYPYYNYATPSTSYINGTQAPKSFFYDLIVPTGSNQATFPIPLPSFSTFAPGPGYDGTQSFYALSQPIGTSVVHYIDAQPFVLDVSGVYAYNLQFPANAIVGNVANYIMTQNTNYQVWAYQQDKRDVTLSWNLTPDLIYGRDEQTSILAIAGNTTDFVFLGAKSNSSSNFSLRIKKFNPASGLLYEFYTMSTFIISNDIQLNTFTYTNTDGFIFSGKTSSNPILYRCIDRLNLQLNAFTADPTANIYHTQDCSSNTFYWLRQDQNYNASTFYQVVGGEGFPGIQWKTQNQGTTPLPKTYRTMAASLFRGQPYETAIDEILFTSMETGFTNNFFSVYQFDSNSGNAIILESVSQFINTDSNPINVSYVQTGYNSSRWFITDEYPYLWANRNNTVDIINRIDSAWQIFYPWQKIVLRKIANNTNPITDLTGIQYPEYPHTELFYYNNFSSMKTDIANRWGCEQSTNFVVANTNFAGFYFNGYIFTCPLRASANSNDKQYIAIRNYSPNEESDVMVRFFLGNKYTFGYTTFNNLGTEANLYKSGQSNLFFDPTYGVVLSNFDNQFQIQKYWGSNLIPGFPGCNLGFSTFQQFSRTYSNLYAQYTSNSATIINITSNVRSNVNNFILTSLKNILPPSALTRQQYTDPLNYSILWKSSLTPNYQNLVDNWGLGYNLGFVKQDTPFGTVQIAQGFYRIIDDYIYLRISPEYNMNLLDFGSAENLSVSRDSTGATKTYYGKLLLNSFNSFSQTLVQNPVSLKPPISKLESVSFQWLEFNGNQVNNTNCDWNISISISEQLTGTSSTETTGA
jgi:hypothetical protein